MRSSSLLWGNMNRQKASQRPSGENAGDELPSPLSCSGKSCRTAPDSGDSKNNA